METKIRIFSNYLWILVLGGFILLLIVFGLLPTLISTPWGKEASLNFLNKKYPEYRIKVDHLSLRWLGPQVLEGVEVVDIAQKQTVSAKTISTDASVWHLLLGKPDIGQMQVISPTADLVYVKKELAALKKQEKAPSTKNASVSSQLCSSLPFSGNLKVKNGHLAITSAELGEVKFEDVQLQVHIPKDSPQLNVTAIGKAEHGQIQGHFDLMSEIDLSDPDNPSITVQSKINDLPIRAVDQLLAAVKPEFQGLLVSAIGTSIDLDLNGKGSSQNMEISLHAASPNFNAYFETETENGMVKLKAPASMDMTITPAFITAWLKEYHLFSHIVVNNNFKGELKVDDFSVPISPKGLDFSSLAFQGSVQFSPITLIGPKNMRISELQASFATPKWSENFTLKISSSIQSNGINGRIFGNGEWKDNFAASVLNIKGKDIPVLFIDQMMNTRGLLGSFFGPSFSFDIYGQNAADKSQVSWQIDSPQSQIPLMTFNLSGGAYVLNAPAKLTFSPSVSHFNTLFPHIQLREADTIQIELTNFSLPKGTDLDRMKFAASMNIPLLKFEEIFFVHDLNLQNLACSLNVNTWDKIEFKVENPDVTLSSTAAVRGQNLQFIQPLSFSILLTNELLHTVLSYLNKPPLLVTPQRLDFSLDPFALCIGEIHLSDLKLKGRGSIPQLDLMTFDGKKAPPLKAINAQFQMDGSFGTVNMDLSAAVENPQSARSDFTAKFSAQDLIFNEKIDNSQAVFKIDAHSSCFSTLFFETWMGQSGLSTAIGPEIDLHLILLSAPQKGIFTLQGTNPQLKMDIALILKNNQWQLQGPPASFKLILNKEGYAIIDRHLSYQKQAQFQLTQPSTLAINIEQLNWPVIGSKQRFPSLSTNWPQLQLKGNLKVDQFSLRDNQSGQTVKLQDFSAFIYKCEPEEPIQISLSGSTSADGKSGKMKVDASLENLYGNDKDKDDLSRLVCKCDVNFQQFPTSLIDAGMRFFGIVRSPFYSLLGETFNATAHTEIKDFSGPISLNLNSPGSRASIVGQLTHGMLTLSEPIYAQLMMTPQLSALFLKDINPFSIKAISAKNPMTLEIPNQGFSLSFHPFGLEHLFIPNGKLEIGEVICHNEGNINIMLNILKAKQLAQENLKLWFAPIDFHIENGIIDCERTEILVADTYDIATWGEIDLPKEHVDMVLGLTANCLEKAFGIKSLPETYVLQIPMRGRSDNVKINTTMATAKIAALIAWQQKVFGGTLGGSTGGALLGELLNKFGPLPDINATTPPAKRPFPWEKNPPPKKAEKTSNPSPHAPKKKNAIKKKDKPLKQLWKILR